MNERIIGYVRRSVSRYGIDTVCKIKRTTITETATGQTKSTSETASVCQLVVANRGGFSVDNNVTTRDVNPTLYFTYDTDIKETDIVEIDSIDYSVVSITTDSENIFKQVFVKRITNVT